jgi:pimeloyl-ACP methyl ester carboxylesterase
LISERTPLILVHGSGVGAEVMAPLAVALGAEFETSCLARPGWDGSPPCSREHYYLEQGARLAAVASPERPALVFAWSSGGFVALHAALQAPERFRGLVLYEPPLWSRDGFSASAMSQFAVFMTLSALGRGTAARRSFWRMVTRRADGRTGFDALPEHQREALVLREGPLLHELLAGTAEELRDGLAALRVPLTVLVGAESCDYVRSGSQRLGAVTPAATSVEVPDADHLEPLAHPEAFAQVLGSLLRSGAR